MEVKDKQNASFSLEEILKNREMVTQNQMNIYERMSAITTALSTVAKNLEVGYGQSKYKAVGEADVLRAVKPLEAKYGVYSYPINRNILETATLETAKGGKQLFERIEVVYRFINVDKPEEYIDIISYGDGLDSGDKSVGKAMTYADKYALMKAYKIITGDDPDQEKSDELKSKQEILNPTLLSKAQELNIDLNNLAIYFKKPLEQLTNLDLQKAIQAKQKALNHKTENN